MTFRKLFLVLAVIMVLPAGALLADDPMVPTDERAAVRAVISSQLEAFQRDDGVAAFSFASPTIKRMFGTPERFMAMVRSGYPAVYRPQEVAFGEIRRQGPLLVQEMLLVGPDGKRIVALYSMVRQSDGSWRIDGVVTLEAPGQTI